MTYYGDFDYSDLDYVDSPSRKDFITKYVINLPSGKKKEVIDFDEKRYNEAKNKVYDKRKEVVLRFKTRFFEYFNIVCHPKREEIFDLMVEYFSDEHGYKGIIDNAKRFIELLM